MVCVVASKISGDLGPFALLALPPSEGYSTPARSRLMHAGRLDALGVGMPIIRKQASVREWSNGHLRGARVAAKSPIARATRAADMGGTSGAPSRGRARRAWKPQGMIAVAAAIEALRGSLCKRLLDRCIK